MQKRINLYFGIEIYNKAIIMQQILFILLSAITFFIAFRQFKKIYNNIQLGKSQDVSGDTPTRWKESLDLSMQLIKEAGIEYKEIEV